MQKPLSFVLALALLAVSRLGMAATQWEAGRNYFMISPAQPTSVAAGKVEVAEVFSYACPACNHFYPIADKLKMQLPSNAQLVFISAAFNPGEDWPMFQRAYYTAQLLGIWNDKVHDAMFDAVWKTGELAIVDMSSNRLKSPAPSIEDAAKFYARVTGVKPDAFVAAASSFGVDVKIGQANQQIRVFGVDQTPTLVVGGKYRLTVGSAGGEDQLIELIKYLVGQAAGGH